MGLLDNARARLTDAVDKHGDAIAQGIDRAAKVADDRTGGRHAASIANGAEKAKGALDRLDARDDDISDTGEDRKP
jgi:hypothetical protein